MTNHRARHLPRPDEHLLLKAATLPPPAALDALEEFLRRYGIRGLTATSVSAVPACYENLKDYPPAAEAIAAFQGAYRSAWMANRRTFHAAAAGIELLQRDGIDTMLLKGAAVVACGYRSEAARAMSDVDCLVPLAQAKVARDLLAGGGWELRLSAGGDPDHVYQMVHGAAFVGPNGGSIDLHWHVLIDSLNEHDDDPFWEAAAPVELHGLQSKSLHHSDMVLHTIAHGARFNEPRILAWVLDAHAIITKHGDRFDWQRLLVQTRRTSQVLQVLSSLQYLRDELGTPVPEPIIVSLRSEKVPFLDRLSYRDNDREDSTIALIRRDISSYLKRSRGRPLGERVRGTVWHLQASREIDNPLTIPFEMAYRLYLRLRGLPPPIKHSLDRQGSDRPPA